MFLEIAANSETIAALRDAASCPVEAHVKTIAATLGEGWDIDRIDGDDGLSLLLTPLRRNATETAFLISTAGRRLELSVLRHDTLRFHGSYGSIGVLLAACTACWASCRADEVSIAVQDHER